MQTDQMFVITQSGFTIRPEGIDLAIAYTKYFIQDARAKLDEYIVVSPCTSFDDPIFAEAQREICRAVDIMRELEEVRGHITRVYDRNFQDWAEVFRQTRLELGLVKIEDSLELYAAVKRTMTMLKAENHWFSESKFINYINKGDEAYGNYYPKRYEYRYQRSTQLSMTPTRLFSANCFVPGQTGHSLSPNLMVRIRCLDGSIRTFQNWAIPVYQRLKIPKGHLD